MKRFLFHVRDVDDDCVKRIEVKASSLDDAKQKARDTLFIEYAHDFNTEIDILCLDSDTPDEALGKVCFTGGGIGTTFFAYEPPED